MKNSPPTPQEIAEYATSSQSQLLGDIVELINASEINDPQLVAHVLCNVLVDLIMGVDSRYPTFPEAGKIAIRFLKNVIKHTKYKVGENNELIDVKTGKEISPGGLKQ